MGNTQTQNINLDNVDTSSITELDISNSLQWNIMNESENMRYVLDSNSNARFFLLEKFELCNKGVLTVNCSDVQCDPDHIKTLTGQELIIALDKLRYIVNICINNNINYYVPDNFTKINNNIV
jgi:hypothetical protein